MMRLPTDKQYALILDSMTSTERMQLEELIDEIVGARATGANPQALEALAADYVQSGLAFEDSERAGALDIAAGLYNRAARLQSHTSG